MADHRTNGLHRTWRPAALILLPVLMLLPWPAAPAPPAQAQTPSPTTITLEYTGAAQTWTVPAGVTRATFSVYGAQGGNIAIPTIVGTGGLGGRATATLAVLPGSVVTIMVGGAGGNANGCSDFAGDEGGAGGFNGGSAGGGGTCEAAGGGGASDVRIGGADLPYRVLVAGGGGGAAPLESDCGPHNGGPGGGLTGGAAPCGGGAGGDQFGLSGSGRFYAGGPGSPGNVAELISGTVVGGGGGGGGGFYGGGGGVADSTGGGGGSGFGPEGAVFETGARAGNGLVTITYSVALDCP